MDGFVFGQQGDSSGSLVASIMGSGCHHRHHHHHPVFAPGATRFLSKPKAEKKSHSEAESRRRKRINDHLTTIRGILPSKMKTDKATLLMETVQYVKELQEKFAEAAGRGDGDMTLPTESELVTVSRSDGNDEMVAVTATVCCKDRAGLYRGLAQTIWLVGGKMIKTKMATVGGRTKVVMKLKLSGGKDDGGEEETERLKRGLRAVVEDRTDGGLFIGGVSCLC